MPSLALLLLLGPASIFSALYYVIPDESSIYDCPYYVDYCGYLDEYVWFSYRFFTSRSTFVFMAGNHSLTRELDLNGISNVVFRREDDEPNTNIVCKLTHNIGFFDVFDVNLTGLTFLLYNYEHDRESALYIRNSNVTIADMIFLGSGDETLPLARAIQSTCSNIKIMDSIFEGNTGFNGGAIYAAHTVLRLLRNSFAGNRATNAGGAISIEGGYQCNTTSLAIIVSNEFTNNSAVRGGAIDCYSNVLAILGETTFAHNQARSINRSLLYSDGGAIYMISGRLYLQDDIYFFGNRAENEGGAILIINSRVETHGAEILSFQNNSEGAIAIYRSQQVAFRNMLLKNNTAYVRSALYLTLSSVVFTGNTNITHNTGRLGGAIQILEESSISFEGYTVIDGNSATSGGAIYSVTGKISFHGRVNLVNNIADDGGALYASGTNITIQVFCNTLFANNFARNGGAMYLRSRSTLSLQYHSTLTIYNNTASNYGGGIYHEDSVSPYQCTLPDNATESTLELLPYCFLRYGYHPSHQFFISNSSYNTAGRDGSTLFGGLLDKCRLISSVLK